MAQRILITAAKEDVEWFLSRFDNDGTTALHLPLEVYEAQQANSKLFNVIDRLESFENIVYSSKRNAKFFLQQIMKDEDNIAQVKNCLNLTINERTFDFLQEYDIPAVHPQDSRKAIDVIELMLRLQRLGHTLYPCGAHHREDFPGLLEELDIPVTELSVFKMEGPSEAQLSNYRDQLQEAHPDVIIFHSRRSVTRTLAAFSSLNYKAAKIISADIGITQKLEQNGISVDVEADGSWASILNIIEKL